MTTNKQVIVLIGGVFDLIHVGHLNILRNAKGLGDKLVVAVTTDECCEREKGKIPVIPYDQRCEMLRELSCVDAVIPQETRDKTELINKLSVDILVAGDDWDKLKGQEVLEERGGKVVFFPYTKFISSSELIERIRRKGSKNP